MKMQKQIADNLPAEIILDVANLPEEKRSAFIALITKDMKTVKMARLLSFFYGLHNIYLKRWFKFILFTITGGGNSLVDYINHTNAKDSQKA